MRTRSWFQLVGLMFLPFVGSAIAQSTSLSGLGQVVEARLKGKVVRLRHVLAVSQLQYGEAGALTSRSKPGDWTLHGHLAVTSSEFRNRSLWIRGNRVALSFKEWEIQKLPQYLLTSEQVEIKIVLNKKGTVDLDAELGKAFLNDMDEIPDNLSHHWHRFLCRYKQTTKGCSTMAYDARAARQSEGGIVNPRLTRQKQPSFSKLAASNKLEGMVELLILVNEHGRVTEFEVVRPLGLGLDEEAIDAVRQWQFTPATQHGKPIGIYMVTSVKFSP